MVIRIDGLPIQKKRMRLTSHQGYRDFEFIKKMGEKMSEKKNN